MQVVNLPYDIFPAGKTVPDDIIFHDYTASAHSLKGKSVLHKNAISLVISGEKTMHFAEKTVRIKSDEFHFLSAGNCLASVTLSPQHIFRSILVFFDNKVLADFHVKYADRTKQYKAVQADEPYVAFRKDKFVLHYIESLQSLIQSNGFISTEMKLLKFEELMLYLLEQYPEKIMSFQATKNNGQDDLVIRKAVEANITSNISLEELAFLCNMSLSTFKRKFLKIYGCAPNKWILQKRMEMARNLLQHHAEKPGDIYHKLGYENHSSFSQAFRKSYGITPKDFQQQEMNVLQ